MRRLLVIAAAGFIAACATPVVNLGTSFDAAAAQRQLADGPHTIQGNAFLRQRGGGVVTCAGAAVHLVPATPYAQELFRTLYGSASGPALRTAGAVEVQPKSDQFGQLQRHTQCDAQGNFRFQRVADGDWFVETVITWSVGYTIQGGAVMRKVRVAGADVSVVVSP